MLPLKRAASSKNVQSYSLPFWRVLCRSIWWWLIVWMNRKIIYISMPDELITADAVLSSVLQTFNILISIFNLTQQNSANDRTDCRMGLSQLGSMFMHTASLADDASLFYRAGVERRQISGMWWGTCVYSVDVWWVWRNSFKQQRTNILLACHKNFYFGHVQHVDI